MVFEATKKFVLSFLGSRRFPNHFVNFSKVSKKKIRLPIVYQAHNPDLLIWVFKAFVGYLSPKPFALTIRFYNSNDNNVYRFIYLTHIWRNRDGLIAFSRLFALK